MCCKPVNCRGQLASQLASELARQTDRCAWNEGSVKVRRVQAAVRTWWVEGRAEDDVDEVTLPAIHERGVSRATGSRNH